MISERESISVESGEVVIPGGDRDIPAYFAAPAKGGAHAVIVAIHEKEGAE